MILQIANIKRDSTLLPVVVDKDRLDSIKSKIVSSEALTDEDMLFYDETANAIMSVLKKQGGATDAAFLFIQLPLIHSEMLLDFIDKVCDEESPLAAYCAITLNRATDSDYRHDELMTILVSKGDIPLLIESVKTLPDVPMNNVLKKLDVATADEKRSWNSNIVIEAKLLHKDFCENLAKPSDRKLSDNENSVDDIVTEDIEGKLSLLTGIMSKSKGLIKKAKNISGDQ